MRRAVIIAVPEGASTLASWCSSMTSAVSKNGAASSAKRIISTAPMAKFGAMRQLERVNADSQRGDVVVREAGRADDRVQPLLRAPGHVGPGGVEDGEVDGHLHLAPRAWRPRSSATAIPATVPPARLRATAATSSSSGSAAMAAHAVVPIRPVAPNTPTRSGALAVIAAPYRSSPARDAGRDLRRRSVMPTGSGRRCRDGPGRSGRRPRRRRRRRPGSHPWSGGRPGR